MATESQQKIYQVMRHQVTARLVRADIPEANLAKLSLWELLNTLFILFGDGGTLGSFVPSFTSALKLVGQDLMWQEPNRILEPQRVQ